MSHTTFSLVFASGLLLLAAVQAWADEPAGSLSLEQAEQRALQQDPAVQRYTRLAEARRAQSVAEGQLPDPRLKLGLANFPTDSFARDQEPMTQLQLGVQQTFPKGRSLEIRSAQAETLAEAEQARAADAAVQALLGARSAWLDLYYQQAALAILADTRELFTHLLASTRAFYATGRQRQQDVVRVELQLIRLEDRVQQAEGMRAQAQAGLGKWVGDGDWRAAAAVVPELPPVAALAELDATLERHPRIRVEQLMAESGLQEVDLAREQYKPGWMLDLTYGERTGQNADGSARADFLGAMVVLDLPLFTDKRQDRRLAASQSSYEAARLSRDDQLRELRRRLRADYADWQRLGERLRLFREQILPKAEQNARVSLSAYQSGVGDFDNMLRAGAGVLDSRLDALKVEVDRAKARARLLYLMGETS